jgi:replicative DNA helicase
MIAVEKAVFKNVEMIGSSMTDINKKFPFSLEVEAAVISAFLLDQSLFQQYMLVVNKDDFYIDYHRNIFQAISVVYEKHGFSDLVFIQDYLVTHNLLDNFVKKYLEQLSENIFSMGLIDQYIPLLKEKTNLRKIISSANSIISQCYDVTIENSSIIIDNAEKLFFEMLSKEESRNYANLDNTIKKVFSTIVSATDSVYGITGVGSGFSKLDEMTCGFQPGDLIIVAARPSMGKTAFALCLARNAALAGNPVGFVSLEMSSEQLVMRILSFDAQVPLSSLRSGNITPDDWISLTSAAAKVSDYKVYIDDTPAQAIFDIKTRARKIFLEKGIKLLIVDYLQLLHINKKFENRHQEVSEISRSLKQLAKELSVPVIALSQLSRGVESRTDKRPLLSDLRDSGALEQDADLILFLYRDIVYNKMTMYPDMAEVIIGKQRNGPTGTVNLRYVKEYTFFDDFDHE